MDAFNMSHAAFCNYSDNAVAELTKYLSSKSSPVSQSTVSSRLMLDDSSLGPRTNKHMPQEANKERRPTQRDRNLVGMACAVCEEDSELTLYGERIPLFSCGLVSHKSGFYEFIKESGSQYCPMSEAPLALATSILISPLDRRE